jgi:hypothetical protein
MTNQTSQIWYNTSIYSTVQEGNYTINVTCNLSDGTTYAFNNSFILNYDITAPTVAVADPHNATSYYNDDYYLGFNVTFADTPINATTKQASSWCYKLDAGSWTCFGAGVATLNSYGGDYLMPAGGDHIYYYKANDSAGNFGNGVVYFTIIDRPESGVRGLLSGAGSGLGNFLTYITGPTVNIVLGLGFVGGLLAIIYGLAMVIGRSMRGSSSSIGQ